jgi:hypothetical protein
MSEIETPKMTISPGYKGGSEGTEYTGAYLISKEELKKAAANDPYLLQILEHIEQDNGFIAALKGEIAEHMRTIRGIRQRMNHARARILSRRKQYDHFLKLLRKRMAFEKIRETRKQLDL